MDDDERRRRRRGGRRWDRALPPADLRELGPEAFDAEPGRHRHRHDGRQIRHPRDQGRGPPSRGTARDFGHSVVGSHPPSFGNDGTDSGDIGHIFTTLTPENTSFDGNDNGSFRAEIPFEKLPQLKDAETGAGLPGLWQRRKKTAILLLTLLVVAVVACVSVVSSGEPSQSANSSGGVVSDAGAGEDDDADIGTAKPTGSATPAPSSGGGATEGPETSAPSTLEPSPAPISALTIEEVAVATGRNLAVNRSLDANGMPLWDWNWVQIWTQRGRRKSAITESDLAFLETYPVSMYVVSKSAEQDVDPEYVHCLTKMTAVRDSIKTVVPDQPVLSYLNSALNFPMLDNVWCPLVDLENAWLQNVSLGIDKPRYGCKTTKKGAIARTKSLATAATDVPLFDLRNEKVTDVMVNFASLSDAAGFQGIFLDRADIDCASRRVCKPSWIPNTFANTSESLRWDAAHDAMMRKIQSEVFPKGLVVGNNRNVPGLKARQHEKFGIEEYYLKPSEALQSFMEGARSGKVMQAFANPCSIDEATIQFSFGTQLVSGRFMRINTLAMFLIGMCRYSYYSCALGFIADNAWNSRQPNNADLGLSDEELWAGNVFYPEYMYNLGVPRGLALEQHLNDGQSLYYREFESNLTATRTRVWLHIKSERYRSDTTGTYDIRSVIEWADGNFSSSDSAVNGTSIREAFAELFPTYSETSFVEDDNCTNGIY